MRAPHSEALSVPSGTLYDLGPTWSESRATIDAAKDSTSGSAPFSSSDGVHHPDAPLPERGVSVVTARATPSNWWPW